MVILIPSSWIFYMGHKVGVNSFNPIKAGGGGGGKFAPNFFFEIHIGKTV